MSTAVQPDDLATPGSPQSKDSGFRQPGSSPGNPIFLQRGRDDMLSLPQTTAWVDGMVLYGFSLHELPGRWRAILKASRRGRFFVCFINGDTWQETLETALEQAEKGVLAWWPDKYPPK